MVIFIFRLVLFRSLSLLYKLLSHENKLAHLHKAFQILKKLVSKLLATQVDAGKDRVSQRPAPPLPLLTLPICQ